jgi:hypothetical protein
MEFSDQSFGDGNELHVGKGQMLVEGGDILLVA